MAYEIICPNCNRINRPAYARGGQIRKCVKCGHNIKIPKRDSAGILWLFLVIGVAWAIYTFWLRR